MCHSPSSYPGCQGFYPRAAGEVTVPLGTAIDEGYSQMPLQTRWAPSQGDRLEWLPLGTRKSFVSGPDAEGALQHAWGQSPWQVGSSPPDSSRAVGLLGISPRLLQAQGSTLQAQGSTRSLWRPLGPAPSLTRSIFIPCANVSIF